MWCYDLTKCLTGDDGQVLEAVQEAEERCFQVGVFSCYVCKGTRNVHKFVHVWRI